MSSEQFQRVMNKLDTLIKITAINTFQGKSRIDVVRILSSLGFPNKDIAEILGTTAAYVAKVKYESKKKRKKKRRLTKKSAIKEVE